MATPLDSPDDKIFEKLQENANPKITEEKAELAALREQLQLARSQLRLAELIKDNSTLPVTIASIRVLNAPNTRRSFLQGVLKPIIDANKEQPSTLAEALASVDAGAGKLARFGIFALPITLNVTPSSKTDPSTTPTDLDFYLTARERPRFTFSTGTEVGNAEGAAYAHGQGRNLFGGAEAAHVSASIGTRTRNAYSASFDAPILSNPGLHWEFGGLASSTAKPWSSYEEVLRGGWTKLQWSPDPRSNHEVTYKGTWRQNTGLSPRASPTIRSEAGDNVKSSISHTWTHDQRDHPTLPRRGYFARSILELAGWGPLQGDVAFGKGELETQAAVPIPIPFLKSDPGISLTAGLRGGLLYPLPLPGSNDSKPSRINDRFSLGGPGDVRGFRLSGLGPHDGSDAVGGDVYVAGAANLLVPLPRVGKQSPFRFQAFVSGGRLFALPSASSPSSSSTSTSQEKSNSSSNNLPFQNFQNTVTKSVQELGNGLPSMAAGIGLVYAADVARFELNFSLPLVMRKGEEGRKGLQIGVGINML